MSTRRSTALFGKGEALLPRHDLTTRGQIQRMLALAAAGLVVIAFGVSHAQSAQAAANLTHAKELAVAEVGSRVGVGAAGVDVAALRGAAASALASAEVTGAQGLLDEAGPALGAERVVSLAAVRDQVLTLIRLGGGVDALVAGAAALEAEQQATSTALAAHRAAEAARLAAEVAAAEIARAAAAAAAADASSHADAGDAAASPAAADSTDQVAAAASTTETVNPYTAEFYPGLPAAPRPEDCGPCNGKPMYPVFYNGSYTWGCSA